MGPTFLGPCMRRILAVTPIGVSAEGFDIPQTCLFIHLSSIPPEGFADGHFVELTIYSQCGGGPPSPQPISSFPKWLVRQLKGAPMHGDHALSADL